MLQKSKTQTSCFGVKLPPIEQVRVKIFEEIFITATPSEIELFLIPIYAFYLFYHFVLGVSCSVATPACCPQKTLSLQFLMRSRHEV